MACGAPVCFGEQCEICARRRRYGEVIQALVLLSVATGYREDRARAFEGLDALAEIMRDRYRLIRDYNRELQDADRETQRAYSEGRADGRLGTW